MTIDNFMERCLSMKGATEDFPFDETTLCFRVGGKIFALTDLEDLPRRANLKCDPERAVELREQYEGIVPGYHMNKKMWNTVFFDSDAPDELIYELVTHSYELVFGSLSKKLREEITGV